MNNRHSQALQPLDRTALTVIVVLFIIIGIMLLTGNRATAKVRDFSWQDQQISANDTAFILTFSRPMDKDSVAENLKLSPSLPGKTSWAGRRMAYTLEHPVPYGTTFDITLEGGRDLATASAGNSQKLMRPFQSQFQTRDRVFAYIGIEAEEQGRLVLYNLTRQEQHILTPEDLRVLDFEPYPEGDRILFSATDIESYKQGSLNQKLYTVTTGLAPQMSNQLPQKGWARLLQKPQQDNPSPLGTIELVLGSQDYQNLKFDLSPDGQTIAVQRVNQRDPSDFGPWVITEDAEPRPLETDPGGDFLIAPDSQTLALSQGEGLALVPLDQIDQEISSASQENNQPSTPLEFLPTFGMVLNFASDGSAAAMVKFNTDYTQSLFLVTPQDDPQEIARISGSILDAQFDPTHQTLYCLMTELLPGDTYIEQPFITAIHLETNTQSAPLVLPIQPDIQVSLAPDGLGLLFDRTVADNAQTSEANLRSSSGVGISTSELWLLPLDPSSPGTLAFQPEALPIQGIQPHWIP